MTNHMAETTEKKTHGPQGNGQVHAKTKRAPKAATWERERAQAGLPAGDRADARRLSAVGGRDPALVG